MQAFTRAIHEWRFIAIEATRIISEANPANDLDQNRFITQVLVGKREDFLYSLDQFPAIGIVLNVLPSAPQKLPDTHGSPKFSIRNWIVAWRNAVFVIRPANSNAIAPANQSRFISAKFGASNNLLQ
ncbi:MAG: hypothetical protein KDJ90_23025 [Nitratireductor sp.]|nr:hypothetical protein [Nitratireductor sp.]